MLQGNKNAKSIRSFYIYTFLSKLRKVCYNYEWQQLWKTKHMLSFNITPAVNCSRDSILKKTYLSFQFSSFGSVTNIYTIVFTYQKAGQQARYTHRSVETHAASFHYIF